MNDDAEKRANATARATVMISAGEASGDAHAAHALAALAARGTPVSSFGMGAGSLAAQGTELLVDCRDLAVIGIVDVLINYPKFLKRLRTLRDAMRARRPDLLIIVDYPDFNLKLAETAKELGIPVLFYISPQVWAWRANRVHRIGSLVTHMAVLFPFEVDVYQQADVPVTYVGHPLVDDAHSEFSMHAARAHCGVYASSLRNNTDTSDPGVPEEGCKVERKPFSGPLITLLPGSRQGELRRHLPVMLDAARQLLERLPDCQFLLPLAGTLTRRFLDEALAQSSPLPLTIVEGEACHAMRAADVVLAASGTATLETALIGTPMVVLYIVSPVNHAIMSRLIQIPDIALVNVVAGRRIVPEYVQHEATPEALSKDLYRLLTEDDRVAQMRADLAMVKSRMGEGGASSRVAKLIEQLLFEEREAQA